MNLGIINNQPVDVLEMDPDGSITLQLGDTGTARVTIPIPEGIQWIATDAQEARLYLSPPDATEEDFVSFSADDIATAVVAALSAPSADLESLKIALLQRLEQRKWEEEWAGIDFNGVKIETDDRSKLLIKTTYDKAKEDPSFTKIWKINLTQRVTLDAPTIIAIGDAVFDHVDNCFNRETELSVLIQGADTIEELLQYQQAVEDFWPVEA